MSEIYCPKGDMCLACHNWMNGCEKLDFSKMRPLGEFEMNGQKYIEVKCERFIKNDSYTK